MDAIKVNTSRYEVVADGVIIISSDSYVDFSVLGLNYRLRFSNDETEGVHYTKNIAAKNTPIEYMDIVFYNVPSSLFTTPSDVIELGNIEGKKLCLRFSISTIQGENNREFILTYNWLMEK